MKPEFRRFGVGPRFTGLSIICAAVVFFVQYRVFDNPTFSLDSNRFNIALGVFLMLAGAFLFVAAIVQFSRCFRKRKLCTHGVYGLMRHPMYGAWIVFIVPGAVIALGSVCGLSVPL